MASGFHRNKNVKLQIGETLDIGKTLDISRRIFIKPVEMGEIQTFFKINKSIIFTYKSIRRQ